MKKYKKETYKKELCLYIIMIYLGSDHGGFKLKEKIKKFLGEKKYEFIDLGNQKYDENDDYPDFAFRVAERVSKEEKEYNNKNKNKDTTTLNKNLDWQKRAKGILFCRSSGGMIIAANKVKNIRAVSVFDIKSAKHARLHNDANIIAISGDWTNFEKAKKIILAWLKTEFSYEERHIRRLNKIKGYENNMLKTEK